MLEKKFFIYLEINKSYYCVKKLTLGYFTQLKIFKKKIK